MNTKNEIDLFQQPHKIPKKISKIFDLVSNTKNELNDLILKNKLQSALKEIPLKPNTINGWGPDDNPQNKILDFKNSTI